MSWLILTFISYWMISLSWDWLKKIVFNEKVILSYLLSKTKVLFRSYHISYFRCSCSLSHTILSTSKHTSILQDISLLFTQIHGGEWDSLLSVEFESFVQFSLIPVAGWLGWSYVTVCQRGYFPRYPIIGKIKTPTDNEVVPPKSFLDIERVCFDITEYYAPDRAELKYIGEILSRPTSYCLQPGRQHQHLLQGLSLSSLCQQGDSEKRRRSFYFYKYFPCRYWERNS